MGNTVIITCLLIYAFIFLNTRWCRCKENSPNYSTLRCKPSERAALLNFKHNLTYFDKDVSSSWEGEECCKWKRVVCDNTTGHILELNLNGNPSNDLLNLNGKGVHHIFKMKNLNSLVYLLELRQLENLDMSFNDFSYSSIPRLMGSMKQLRYLDLSFSSLSGLVPYEFGNLTNLQLLDISNNMFSGEIPASLGKLSNLEMLVLSGASLSGLVPYELGNLTNLLLLYISNNMLSGEIPASLGKLSNLETLVLSANNLSSIASYLRFPKNLLSLDLSHNQLSGKIPTSLGQLSKLQVLVLSYNPLKDTILSEFHFANLSSLIDLLMVDTMLTLNMSSNWVSPFQLQIFDANNCKINGQFPSWLQTSRNLTGLLLHNANISGHMPSWFHTMEQLDTVDLSNNKLSGSPIFPINFSSIILVNNSFSEFLLSNSSKSKKYRRAKDIFLSNNLIAGPLPKLLGYLMPNMENLDLANNQIEGSIPNSLCQSTSLLNLDMQNNSLTGLIPNCWGLGQKMPSFQSLFLSNNQIEGPIPDSLCQLPSLSVLDIQNNSLSGVIPNCLANLSNLYLVSLSYNKLTGHIPFFNTRGSNNYESSELYYLHLNDNMLNGEIPSSLSGFTNLKVLDIGGNQLSGKMLRWFSAENFMKLEIVRLRGNKFSGTIPKRICSLPYLQLLDLGHNHFTGSIPRCLSNLTAMTSPNSFRDYNDTSDAISEVIQGIERAYTSTLPYLVDIDLSSNNLVGRIPDDMTKIFGLLNLNLSYNQLSGTIPVNIGDLKSLVSLDLSKNNLIGSIPTSIGQIYMLSHLNLSYNNLSGQIPTGNQLQTLSDQASIYAGNPYLCGDFLSKKCKIIVDELDKGRSNKGKDNNKEKLEKMGLVLVVMSGFATGFWGVVGSLALNRRWRHAVFRRLEEGYNWLYVIIVLKVRVVKAKINRISMRCLYSRVFNKETSIVTQ